jgi:hypothetical protein
MFFSAQRSVEEKVTCLTTDKHGLKYRLSETAFHRPAAVRIWPNSNGCVCVDTAPVSLAAYCDSSTTAATRLTACP